MSCQGRLSFSLRRLRPVVTPAQVARDAFFTPTVADRIAQDTQTVGREPARERVAPPALPPPHPIHPFIDAVSRIVSDQPRSDP